MGPGGGGGVQNDPAYLEIVSAWYNSVLTSTLLLQRENDCASKVAVRERLGERSMGLTCG